MKNILLLPVFILIALFSCEPSQNVSETNGFGLLASSAVITSVDYKSIWGSCTPQACCNSRSTRICKEYVPDPPPANEEGVAGGIAYVNVEGFLVYELTEFNFSDELLQDLLDRQTYSVDETTLFLPEMIELYEPAGYPEPNAPFELQAGDYPITLTGNPGLYNPTSIILKHNTEGFVIEMVAHF